MIAVFAIAASAEQYYSAALSTNLNMLNRFVSPLVIIVNAATLFADPQPKVSL